MRRGVRYVIDKQPFNHLYVPLIVMMLPWRRCCTPSATAATRASLYYMQWFNTKHGQCNSFDTLGRYADYRRIMDASEIAACARPAPRDDRTSYELLVAEPERHARSWILGMAFDPVVLDTKATDRVVATASRDQVKKRSTPPACALEMLRAAAPFMPRGLRRLRPSAPHR